MMDYLRIIIDARRVKNDERGASAVEYGLLIAGIAALIVVAVFALGPIVRRRVRHHLLGRRRVVTTTRAPTLRPLQLTLFPVA